MAISFKERLDNLLRIGPKKVSATRASMESAQENGLNGALTGAKWGAIAGLGLTAATGFMAYSMGTSMLGVPVVGDLLKTAGLGYIANNFVAGGMSASGTAMSLLGQAAQVMIPITVATVGVTTIGGGLLGGGYGVMKGLMGGSQKAAQINQQNSMAFKRQVAEAQRFAAMEQTAHHPHLYHMDEIQTPNTPGRFAPPPGRGQHS